MNWDRLSVLCFAGTYGLALATDLGRVVTRSSARWFAVVGLTTLGLAIHSIFLLGQAAKGWPIAIGGPRMALLAVAWILAAIDLYLVLRSPRTMAMGVIVLALVLAAIGAAMVAPQDDWAVWGGWLSFWGQIHGILLSLGAVSTCVAFAFGLMYLLQSSRLKRKLRATTPFGLPSLEFSERWHRMAITVAFPMLTAGIAIGLVLLVATKRSGAGILSWSDPKVLSTAALWLVFTVLLHARYRPEMRGRRLMILTVVAFGFMLFAVVGVRLLPTAHGVRPGTAAEWPGARR
jgi:ABC-type uncharacterized transport system permease subunit